MTYASVCSGIEAATVAWQQIPGWHPCWFSQYDPEHNYKSGPDFPSRVLHHHYPHVPNLGDMLKLETNDSFIKSSFQLLVGGTPCQSFSLAGLRGGLDDVRGNLSLEFCRILAAKKPRWFVWENVPGVHSSFSDEKNNKENTHHRRRSKKPDGAGGGRNRITDPNAVVQSSDFARLLEAFQECGYSVCWRILNSQFFGVPQRRRRVFVVGYLGTDWRPPFAVLFEQNSLCRDITKSKKERKATAGKTATGAAGAGEWWDGGQTSQTIDAVVKKQQAMPDKNRFPALLQNIDTDAISAPETFAYQNKKEGLVAGDKAATLKSKSPSTDERSVPAYVTFGIDQDKNAYEENSGPLISHKSGGNAHAVAYNITFYDSNGRRKDRVAGDLYVNETDKANTLTNVNDNKTLITQPLVFNIVQITHPDNGSNPQPGNPSPTLHKDGQPHVVVIEKENAENWALDSLSSNSMKSDNPHSGFHKEDIVKTSDTTTPDPSKNQGGNMIFQEKEVIVFKPEQSAEARSLAESETTSPTLKNGQSPAVAFSTQQIIRRLTPLECERLQGFPDNYTLIPIKKVSKNQLAKLKTGEMYGLMDNELWHLSNDSNRYQAIGNSMTTNVMLWIGQRIDKVDKMLISLGRYTE